MTWNFRLVKRADSKSKRVQYGVHEVFYNDEGKPFTMTEDPVAITGESRKETREYLEMILKDISRFPVLDLRHLWWAKPPWNPALLKDLKTRSHPKTHGGIPWNSPSRHCEGAKRPKQSPWKNEIATAPSGPRDDVYCRIPRWSTRIASRQ